ncbi:IPIL1 protein, partial [Grallaria varia]|nr:IPIL1 protein [Grallaria varia]
PAEDFIPPSTTWLETFAVAEAMFFQHIAKRAPRHSCYLKCLQLCARILESTDFSHNYAMKTVVMHLLTLIPLPAWCHRDFLMRLDDIMQYVNCCLEEKRLNHFFFANEDMPKEINLPPAFQISQPLNLFQKLAQDPDAQDVAWLEFNELKNQLRRQLFYG